MVPPIFVQAQRVAFRFKRANKSRQIASTTLCSDLVQSIHQPYRFWTHFRYRQAKNALNLNSTAYASGSSVNGSCGCATPRSAYRPTETRGRLVPPTAAKADDIRTG